MDFIKRHKIVEIFLLMVAFAMIAAVVVSVTGCATPDKWPDRY